MTVHAPQPPPPQPYLVPVNLTEVAVKERTGLQVALRLQHQTESLGSNRDTADVKDTPLSEEGQQVGFRVDILLRYLLKPGEYY